MSSDRSIVAELLRSTFIRNVLITITLSFSIVAVGAPLFGWFKQASQLAAVASAFATILLVSLTAEYAEMTQRLAEEAESDRAQRKELHEQEQRNELRALRRGLHEEIGHVENYDDYVEEYDIGTSVYELAAPTTVYEQNADRIGLLEEDEIEAIVEYYTRLDHIQTEIDTQRRLDTTDEMGLMREYFERWSATVDFLLRTLTGERYGQRVSQQRAERIRSQFSELIEAQTTALEAIESNLQSDSV